MTFITLVGKTKKGKERVKLWGSRWFIIDTGPLLDPPHRLLVASEIEVGAFSPANGTNGLKSARLVEMHGDVDFEVTIEQ